MIAAWMFTATLFTVLMGVAALAGERALRTLRRQARAPWIAALATSLVWPVIAPVAALLSRTATDSATVVASSAGSTIGSIAATLRPIPAAWFTYANASLIALWGLASMALLARLFLAMRALSSVERSATRDVLAGVPVLVTSTLGPAVFGARRPRLLVPRWLLDLDAPLRALVLHHEQEHCRARDPQLALAAAVAVALVPWNAGVWWIARRLRLAVELDCDARVLGRAQDRERYGKLLLFIAQRQSETRLAPMLAESNSHLSRRISAMNAPTPTNPRARVALLVLAASVAVAASTKYASALTTPPSLGLGAPAGLAARGDTTCLMGAAAAQARNSAVPRYPDALKAAEIEGEVLVAFVVRPSGKADAATLKVIRSTHELFTNAVRNALPNMTFVPPEVGGRQVSQLVQQPYLFEIRTTPNVPAASCSAPGQKGVWTLAGIVVRAP